MPTSVNELRKHLRDFLSDASKEREFQEWFAVALRDAPLSKDPSAEELAHEIMWAFVDQSRGLYKPGQLMEALTLLATEPPKTVLAVVPEFQNALQDEVVHRCKPASRRVRQSPRKSLGKRKNLSREDKLSYTTSDPSFNEYHLTA